MNNINRVYTLEECKDGTFRIQYDVYKVLCREIRDKEAGEYIVQQLNERKDEVKKDYGRLDGLNEAGKHYLQG